MKIFGLLARLSLLAPVGLCVAESAPDSPADPLEEVVVVANRAPEPLSRVGNSVTVLDETTIRNSQTVVVSDLLATTPGINFSRNGGIGGQTQLFIRGADTDQVVVLIDGVQLNDPSVFDGGFDFANLLSGDISRIEILRGSHSTLYGSQAIGGVIDITTTAPSAEPSGYVVTEGGSRSTGLVNAAFGTRSGDLGWRLAAEHFQTAGIPAFDRYLGGRMLDGNHSNGATARLDYTLDPDWTVDLRAYTTQVVTRFDGYDTPTGAFGDDREYGTTSQSIIYAGLRGSAFGERLQQRFAVQLTDTTRRNYDPALSPDTRTFIGVGRNYRYEYQATAELATDERLVLGLQHERSTLSTDTPAYDASAPGYFRADTRTDSVYAEMTSTLLHTLTLNYGARHDRNDQFGGHTTAQLAAAWAPDDGTTVLRSSFSQGFKSPALYQLYSPYGNTALQPESADSWDAGVERHLRDRRALVSATYFGRRSRDLIGFFDCSDPAPQCAFKPNGFYINTARATARGIELQANTLIGSAWSLNANYTLMQTRDQSPGSPTFGRVLFRRPGNLGNLALAWCPSGPVTTTIAVRYAGPSFDDPANQVVLGGYVLIDLRFSYELGAHFEAYGRVENLTDHHYENAYQYGTFGRGYFAGVRARL